MQRMSAEDLKFIGEATRFLENPSFLMRAADTLGKPLEKSIKVLPARAQGLIKTSTQKALNYALGIAVKTIPAPTQQRTFTEALDTSKRSSKLHTAGTVALGAASGFFGMYSLTAELPLTTGIMLRSIADTAQKFGEDPRSFETQLECLSILAYGAKANTGNPADSVYFTTRIGLESIIREATQFISKLSAEQLAEALAKGSSTLIVRLVSRVASRFELVVSEKLAAQTVPIVGAAGGAAINGLFTEHFNRCARYHFGIRRLEREYGATDVRAEYDKARLLPKP